jgi:uncharacterized membrane protein YccC
MPAVAKTGAWIRSNRAQLRLGLRMTIASLCTYALGNLLGLQQSLWAVLTSIIVMQASVGASLKAMLDRMTGSLGGAVAGVVVSLGLHRFGLGLPVLTLLIGVPPLTLLAALKPSYRVAPITFIILVMSPNLLALGPVAFAVQRVAEIALGSVIALVVSLFVLPARAHDAVVEAAAQALQAMAELMAVLQTGLSGAIDGQAMGAAHDRIRRAIGKVESAAEEAKRERSSFLTGGADPQPLCRTLRRLRHDLASLGRTMTRPLPGPAGAALTAPILGMTGTIADFFRDCAGAVGGGAMPPAITELQTGFAEQTAAMAQLRRDGQTLALADDEVARLFGLGFALEQLRRDLVDLAERVAEMARPVGND